ncbi:MAG: hypothetical protein AAB602_01500 [Patescibacteria group bacterium]
MKHKTPLRIGVRVELKTDFVAGGGLERRFYPRGSRGTITTQIHEHWGQRRVKTVEMDSPSGQIVAQRECLAVIRHGRNGGD